MPHLVHQIQNAVHLLPKLSRGIVVDQSGSPSADSAFHLTYNPRDILKDTVTATPVEYYHPIADDWDGYMLRTLDGDLFGSRPALKAVLEKSVREQLGSGRASSEGMEGPYQLLSLDDWKAKYPRRSCRLWSNGRREWRRLVDACVVAGSGEQSSSVYFPRVRKTSLCTISMLEIDQCVCSFFISCLSVEQNHDFRGSPECASPC